MRPFLPKRYEHLAFGFMLSCLMSVMVSGFATLMALGITAEFPLHWLKAWLPSWAMAFPVVLVVAPFVRRTIARITIQP
ncbi:MAG: hypothetical protein RLZZ444_2022 [Pseudomonadota bacterium]|jgi:hypothetical protein